MSLLTYPCDAEEVDEESAELREIVDRFDNLFEDCYRKRMRDEDQKELDEIYSFLSFREEDLWRDTSPAIVARLTDLVDIPFPLLRYTIGMFPE